VFVGLQHALELLAQGVVACAGLGEKRGARGGGQGEGGFKQDFESAGVGIHGVPFEGEGTEELNHR
jgi:hypothetical protein